MSQTGQDELSLQPVLRATSVIYIFLTTVFTVARLIAKKSFSTFHVEDYLSLAAWLAATAEFTTIQFHINIGLGRPVTIESDNGTHASKLGYVASIFYTLTIAFAKGALLYQLQRIFCPCKKGVVYVVAQILIWVNFTLYFGVFLSTVVRCIPLAKTWDPSITTGRCINFFTILIVTGVISVVSNILIVLLPIWAIYHLKVPLKKKLVSAAMFTTGGLAFVSSVLRLVYSLKAMDSNSPAYAIAKVILCTFGEFTSLIMCTCLPMMPRFIKLLTTRREGGHISRFFRRIDSESGPVGELQPTPPPSSSRHEKRETVNSINELRSDSSRGIVSKTRNDQQWRKQSDGTLTESFTMNLDPKQSEKTGFGAAESRASGSSRITVQRDFYVEHGISSIGLQEKI